MEATKAVKELEEIAKRMSEISKEMGVGVEVSAAADGYYRFDFCHSTDNRIDKEVIYYHFPTSGLSRDFLDFNMEPGRMEQFMPEDKVMEMLEGWAKENGEKEKV